MGIGKNVTVDSSYVRIGIVNVTVDIRKNEIANVSVDKPCVIIRIESVTVDSSYVSMRS